MLVKDFLASSQMVIAQELINDEMTECDLFIITT